MTIRKLFEFLFWPEAVLSAGGLVALSIDVRLAIVLLSLGASLHTTGLIGLFTLPEGEE